MRQRLPSKHGKKKVHNIKTQELPKEPRLKSICAWQHHLQALVEKDPLPGTEFVQQNC